MRLVTTVATVALGTAALTSARCDEAGPVLSRAEIVARYPRLDVNAIKDAPLAGFYEVAADHGIAYISKDGRYLIRGDIFQLSDEQNLTELSRAAGRAALFAGIDPKTEIVYSPANGSVKHRLIVFTDVDCGYCRQFHRDIAKFNALGIEVRYVAYPRTGPNTEAWTKAEHVWCAADRKTALTRAKLGDDVPAVAGCSSTPVAEHYALGRRIGLGGTPGVYAENGFDLGGYVPPEAMLERLERAAASLQLHSAAD